MIRAVARELARDGPFMAGVVLLAGFLLLALAHPVLMTTTWAGEHAVYHPVSGHDPAMGHPAPPQPRHLLGTDALGRDVLSMLTFATRGTLVVGLTTAVVVGLLSLLVGTVSAYWRGPVDIALSHLSDGMLLLPAPIAMIAVGLARPGLLSPLWFGLAYGLLTGLGAAAIVVRSHGLVVMAKPFIDAARVAGGGAWHIMRAHLVPHLLPLAAIQTMLAVTGAIVVSGFVEFMSPGRADRVGYGSLVYSGLTYQEIVAGGTAWAVLLAGALAISLLCAAFYLLSVGLRRRVDPTTAREPWIPL
jgi:peptide/nickel transport system permease protein